MKSLAQDAYRRGGVPEVIGSFEDKGMDALQHLSTKYQGAKKKLENLALSIGPNE